MTHHTEAKTIILPTDVDDINGYGAKQALELCGIDRDTEQTLADIIEEQWWAVYRDHAAEALTAAGYNVVLADGSMTSPEVADLERRYADELAEIDELPCDMSAVSHAATDDLWAWWQANAETLIAEHVQPPASPIEIWREVVDNEVQDRKVTLICKGYAWESHRDIFEPDATDEDALKDAARQAVDEWLAMTPAERAAR